jgi:UDP-N-acetylmuramate--alanine ligase
MNLSNLKNIYFLGIGGIGMSALARYFNLLGVSVYGYDRTPTALTSKLIEEGINIHFDDDINQIPTEVDLVVYTPAIPPDLNEYQYILKHNIPLVKRAILLGQIADEKRTIAVAGTHGKTTVSTMISHLLHNSKLRCNAFLGGIAKNYNSNFLFDEDADFLVAEADEYDQSFLSLHPELAVITSTDADHLDIYGEKHQLLESFQQFARQLRPEGKLLIKKGLDFKANQDVEIFTYSLKGPADFHATNIRLIDGFYCFSFVTPDSVIDNLTLGVPGLINVENAVAALSIAYMTGVSENEFKKSLKNFGGINRRFDIRFKSDDHLYIDDYAHHPKEIDAFLGSVKEMFPNKKILGIFQPHLYSRTKDFAVEFAKSLELLDEIILLPIYPAREKPIDGVKAEIILDKINAKNKKLLAKERVSDYLNARDFEILVTMGAGDIDQLVIPICQMLENKYKTIPS